MSETRNDEEVEPLNNLQLPSSSERRNSGEDEDLCNKTLRRPLCWSCCTEKTAVVGSFASVVLVVIIGVAFYESTALLSGPLSDRSWRGSFDEADNTESHPHPSQLRLNGNTGSLNFDKQPQAAGENPPHNRSYRKDETTLNHEHSIPRQSMAKRLLTPHYITGNATTQKFDSQQFVQLHQMKTGGTSISDLMTCARRRLEQ